MANLRLFQRTTCMTRITYINASLSIKVNFIYSNSAWQFAGVHMELAEVYK